MPMAARAFRVTVPPATATAIAIQLANTAQPPSVLAWTEPALAAHNRQLAIFITAVWALIGSAALIAGGLAVMLGHAPARWAALTLLFVLLERLAETGLFDGSLATAVGGPYGLQAMFAGLSLAAGIKLADAIVPVGDLWPFAPRWFSRGLWIVVGLSIFAYLGIPGATILTALLVVLGTCAHRRLSCLSRPSRPSRRSGGARRRALGHRLCLRGRSPLPSPAWSPVRIRLWHRPPAASRQWVPSSSLWRSRPARGIAVLPFQSVAAVPMMPGPHIEAPLQDLPPGGGAAIWPMPSARRIRASSTSISRKDLLTLSPERRVADRACPQ